MCYRKENWNSIKVVFITVIPTNICAARKQYRCITGVHVYIMFEKSNDQLIIQIHTVTNEEARKR